MRPKESLKKIKRRNYTGKMNKKPINKINKKKQLQKRKQKN